MPDGDLIMCLAIPSRIVEIQSNVATIDVEGVRRQASLMLVEDARVGDYVIVHAGFAIQILDESAARESLQLLRDFFMSDGEDER
ncbi:MAG: HypC/HybG/HupF family hydrogenase formation chaperone [Desulfosudaceae bacterium]